MGTKEKANKYIVAALLVALIAVIGLAGWILVFNDGQMPGAGGNGAGGASEPVIKASSVAVECGNLSGCGNVVAIRKKTLVIATARHIIESRAEPITVTFYDDNQAKARVLKESKQLDVAILEVQRKKLKNKGKAYTPVLDDDDSAESAASGGSFPLPETEIFMRNALTDQIYAGTVALPAVYSEDFVREVIMCYCVVDPGMSGTGLFDGEDNYLGILLGSTDDGEAVCIDSRSVIELIPE